MRYGLIRINSGAMRELPKQSGQSGVLVEPLKWDKPLGLPDTFPRWLPLEYDDSKESMIERALPEKPSWGFIRRGRRQLGVRELVTEDTVVSRTWVLQIANSTWMDEWAGDAGDQRSCQLVEKTLNSCGDRPLEMKPTGISKPLRALTWISFP